MVTLFWHIDFPRPARGAIIRAGIPIVMHAGTARPAARDDLTAAGRFPDQR